MTTIEARAEALAQKIYDALVVNDDVNSWHKDMLLSTITAIITAEMAGADEVESALAVLRQKYPTSHFTEISHDWSAFDSQSVKEKWQVIVQEKMFYGDTLAAALDAAMKEEG